METVGAIEAGRRFAEILEMVGRGESVAVTNQGRHVATIVPAAASRSDSVRAIEGLVACRERIRREGRGLTVREILAARNEGRK